LECQTFDQAGTAAADEIRTAARDSIKEDALYYQTPLLRATTVSTGM
jgi:hypothetical protein